MSDDTYTPNAVSLADQVVNYFRIHPTGTLTIDEIRDRFGFKGNVVTALGAVMVHDLIEREEGFDGAFFAGAKMPSTHNPSVISTPYKSNLTKAFEEALAPNKGKNKGRGHSQLPAFDVDAAKVEKGVPIPAATVRKKLQSKWAPLLDKLAEKGDSVALPDQYRGTIDSYIRKLTKARADKVAQFRTGRDDGGVTRIWRIA